MLHVIRMLSPNQHEAGCDADSSGALAEFHQLLGDLLFVLGQHEQGQYFTRASISNGQHVFRNCGSGQQNGQQAGAGARQNHAVVLMRV